jgi:prevent-host-death family protein
MTSTEAQNNFGALLDWAEQHREGVIVERRGRPVAAMIAYAEYEEWQRLRDQERKQQALQELRSLRASLRAAQGETVPEDLYRAAGMGEKVIRELRTGDEGLE